MCRLFLPQNVKITTVGTGYIESFGRGLPLRYKRYFDIRHTASCLKCMGWGVRPLLLSSKRCTTCPSADTLLDVVLHYIPYSIKYTLLHSNLDVACDYGYFYQYMVQFCVCVIPICCNFTIYFCFSQHYTSIYPIPDTTCFDINDTFLLIYIVT